MMKRRKTECGLEIGSGCEEQSWKRVRRNEGEGEGEGEGESDGDGYFEKRRERMNLNAAPRCNSDIR